MNEKVNGQAAADDRKSLHNASNGDAKMGTGPWIVSARTSDIERNARLKHMQKDNEWLWLVNQTIIDNVWVHIEGLNFLVVVCSTIDHMPVPRATTPSDCQ